MATARAAVIGDNNPPEPTPIDAAKDTLADLTLEAQNWFDGAEVENQAQADEVSRIIDAARKAGKAFDGERKTAKQPHMDAAKAVDAEWKPLIDGAERVATVGKAALTPFLMAQEAEKRAREAEARRVAEEAAAVARKAAQEAQNTFAGAVARDEAIERAEAAQAEADAAARAKANAKGQGVARALSLRTTYRATVTDRRALLNHVALTRPDDLTSFLEQWAATAVRTGTRSLPGVEIHEEKVAA
jgi:hypothetical protein